MKKTTQTYSIQQISSLQRPSLPQIYPFMTLVIKMASPMMTPNRIKIFSKALETKMKPFLARLKPKGNFIIIQKKVKKKVIRHLEYQEYQRRQENR